MKRHSTVASILAVLLLFGGLTAIPARSGATTLGGPDGPSTKTAVPSKNDIVTKYLTDCRTKPFKAGDCDKTRKDAIEILKEDLRTLGSSAQRTYLPAVLDVFMSEEPVLRIAAADAIGMIGPQDADVDLLAPLANDPVPDVRRAVSQALSRGKGSAVSLLGKRAVPLRDGMMPETPPDAAKLGLLVAPNSAYWFDSSDPLVGRASYLVKNLSEATAFYKGKAKKGPIPWEEFREQYSDQLQDEDEAMNLAASSQIETLKPPDPTNMEAFIEYMQKITSVGTRQGGRLLLDLYHPEFFGSPTVYVLEERQIGRRKYPTRFVVLYQDLALKKPGYRLSWTTASDETIKKAQAASLSEEGDGSAK